MSHSSRINGSLSERKMFLAFSLYQLYLFQFCDLAFAASPQPRCFSFCS